MLLGSRCLLPCAHLLLPLAILFNMTCLFNLNRLLLPMPLQPLLRSKLSGSAMVFTCDENGTRKASMDVVEAGCHAVPILQPRCVWTMSGRFGISLDTVALMVYPRKEKTAEDLFVDFSFIA